MSFLRDVFPYTFIFLPFVAFAVATMRHADPISVADGINATFFGIVYFTAWFLIDNFVFHSTALGDWRFDMLLSGSFRMGILILIVTALILRNKFGAQK